MSKRNGNVMDIPLHYSSSARRMWRGEWPAKRSPQLAPHSVRGCCQTFDMAGRPARSINSFVSFDIETTGLPCLEYNKTKITEMAFVATSRESVLSTPSEIPRVTHKLTVCLNPYRMIQPEATNITGLSNEDLEKEKSFDKDACNLISLFLSRLEAPVCLVAHNGMKFDFPILRSQISEVQMELPNEILCVDSYVAFQQLFSEIPLDMMPAYVQKRKARQSASKSVDNGASKNSSDDSGIIPDDRSFMQKMNETTPERNKRESISHPDILHLIKAKRRLFPDDESKPFLRSFKLKDIYKFISGKDPYDIHRAENDAIILLACMTGLGSKFIDWADENAISFNTVKKMR